MALSEESIRNALGGTEVHVGCDLVKGEFYDVDYGPEDEWAAGECEGEVDG